MKHHDTRNEVLVCSSRELSYGKSYICAVRGGKMVVVMVVVVV
jgi:hypothetical protein